MAKITETTMTGLWYSISCTAAVTVTESIGGEEAVLVRLSESGQAVFRASGACVVVESEGLYTMLPSEAPAAGCFGGGGGVSAEAVQEVVPMRWGSGVTVGSAGDGSVAFGGSASGGSAIAVGDYVEASGFYAIALGYYANASSGSAIALGNSANASSGSAIALGNSANARGGTAIALGSSANARANFSTAVGYNAEASGTNSVALGYYAKASKSNSIAIGYQPSASGNYAIALGYQAKAANDGQLVLNAHHGDNTDFSLELQAGAAGSGTGALGAADEFVTGACVCFRVKNGSTGQEESVTIEAGKLFALLRRVDELLALLPAEVEAD